MNKLNNTLLTKISPLDGRYHRVIEPLSDYASESALIYIRIKIEVLYFIALSDIGIVRKLSSDEKTLLKNIYSVREERKLNIVKKYEAEVNHDVKAVELFLRNELKNTSLKDSIEKLHYCLTSEDVNNLAYRIMLKSSLDNIFFPTASELLNELLKLTNNYKGLVIMGRTHGQDAVPTTFGKEIAVFTLRLAKIYKTLKNLKLTGKFNGAIGGWNAHVFIEPHINWEKISKNFVESLGLKYEYLTTQINHFDDVVKVLNNIHLFNSILLGLNQDLWRYISDGWIKQKPDPGQVGSSTMAQKINPIHFENSEGNICIANGLVESLVRNLPISRMQRDLSNSTIVRNLATILGYEQIVLSSAIRGLSKISANKQEISEYLNKNWAVLSEPLQILLRKHNIKDAYNIVKELTMGQKINQEEWKNLISKLDLEPEIKKAAEKISIDDYTGLCESITDQGIKEINLILKLYPSKQPS